MTSRPRFSLSADITSFEGGASGIAIKIQADPCELNVWLTPEEASRLREIPRAPWGAGAVRLGSSAGSPAFWSCDDGEVFVCVGHDDETWDFGVSFPDRLLPGLASEVERLLDGESQIEPSQ